MNKPCQQCGKELQRKRFNARLEDASVFKTRIYCDPNCYALSKIKKPESMAAFKERMIEPVDPKQARKCNLCQNLAYGQGLCSKHLARLKRNGHPNIKYKNH